MAEYKDVYSSPVTALKFQLAVEQPSTERCWNRPKKIYPTSKHKGEVATRWWEECYHGKIKSHTHCMGVPQTGKQ